MKNILIIKTGSIGDVLRTTCIIPGLIDKYLSPRIYWLTSNRSFDVIKNNPFINKIFLIESPDEDIKKINFDMVISLEEDKNCLDLLSKLKTKMIFGVYGLKGKTDYTPKSSYWYNMSLISKFGKQTADELKRNNIFSYPEILYKMIGLEWKGQKPLIFLKEDIKNHSVRKIESLNFSQKTVVGIVVGSGERWPMKALPADLQIKLIKKLKKEIGKDIEILLITGPAELELNVTKSIKKELPFVKTHEIVDLDTLFGIISLCDVIITPDTLSMHIAIALSKYVVAYFTITPADEIEIYPGEKIITKDKKSYGSLSKENEPRPNCTDKVDLDEIVLAVKKAMN